MMIDKTAAIANLPPPSSKPVEPPGGAGSFDAALKAAQAAAARDQERKRDLDSIRDKGFTDWVRDTRIEKLKEELRKKVMAAMGVTEEDMAKMAPAIREILEAKIREAVEQQMQEELAKSQGETTGPTAAAAPMAPGKIDPQTGKKVPVIPALIQAGGESLF